MDQRCILTESPGKAPYYSFPALLKYPFLRHGFSTRQGGVSKRAEFATMNLDLRHGDDKTLVLTNYRRICDSIGIPVESLVLTDQVHESVIRSVTAQDCGKGIWREKDYQGVDGLITAEPFVTLTVFGADCVPLFFVSATGNVIGTAHAGWRGTLAGIAPKMVQRFQEEYSVTPPEIEVVIGPSICRNCYEVSKEVADKFLQTYPQLSIDALEQKNEEKYQLDLWEMNRQLLLRAGVLPERITVSGVCTCCHPQLLFSHRASNGKRGLLAGFLMMTEKNRRDS